MKRTLLPICWLLWWAGCSPAPEATPPIVDGTCTCTATASGQPPADSLGPVPEVRGGMLATRFQTLEELKTGLCIEYFHGEKAGVPGDTNNTEVRLTHCSQGRELVSVLKKGVSEGDFNQARSGGFGKQLNVAMASPWALTFRQDLQRVIVLARRRPALLGEGDVAFYDLAEASVDHINTPELAYYTGRDSSEKGYINSFNHMTAQAFITTFMSEEMADFVADVHERHHMPELMTGAFSPGQLTDPEKNPVDNYVDMVNNEWGQELGKQLAVKYNIDRHSEWPPELLAAYLNDLQSHYSWAFQIGLEPFRPEDNVVQRFAEKIEFVRGYVPE